MNMEALPCWNFGDLFVEKNCWSIISRVQHDRLLVTRARHWRLNWELLSFPGLWCISLPSEAERNWVVAVWDLVDISLQHSGVWSRTFYLFFSAAVKGREKQLMVAMGAEHWELTFKSAWLNCPAWRSRSSPTAEKVSTLTHVGAVSGVCGLSPVSAMIFCRTVPSTEARKSMTMSNTLMRVTTECVHACVHRRLDKKKKESDVNFYLFSKHLESGNVDNCIIWSKPSFLKINFRSRHLSFPFLFVLFYSYFERAIAWLSGEEASEKKRSNTKKRRVWMWLRCCHLWLSFFILACRDRRKSGCAALLSFTVKSWFFFFYQLKHSDKKKGACSIASERERERERERFFLLSLVIFDRSIPASIGIIVINDKKNQLNKKIANVNKKCVLSKTESFQLTWMKLIRERPQWQSQK